MQAVDVSAVLSRQSHVVQAGLGYVCSSPHLTKPSPSDGLSSSCFKWSHGLRTVRTNHPDVHDGQFNIVVSLVGSLLG